MSTVREPTSRRHRLKGSLSAGQWRTRGAWPRWCVGLHALGFFMLIALVAPHHYQPRRLGRVRRRVSA